MAGLTWLILCCKAVFWRFSSIFLIIFRFYIGRREGSYFNLLILFGLAILKILFTSLELLISISYLWPYFIKLLSLLRTSCDFCVVIPVSVAGLISFSFCLCFSLLTRQQICYVFLTLKEVVIDQNSDVIIIMSKYKYEKEFMFSNQRLDEVELYLQNQENPLDLFAIRDSHKNTVIHHTAYHNQTKVLELYLKYYRKNLQNQHRNIGEIKMQTRYLLDEPNAEGYTAVHYATYRGNISVLKILEKYQANFYLINHLKMGVLHLAAQGDKLSSFLFLHNKKLDLNNRDLKQSTPLHWAAFSGSEKIVEYLLAQQSIEINPVDVEGFTPLHLATTYGNSKIVKKLLIAGADRSPVTNKDQTALQIAEEKEFHSIQRMLNQNYSFTDRLKIICNAKVRYKSQQKSYIPVFVFTLVTLLFSILSFLVIKINYLWLEIVQGSIYLFTFSLYLSLVFKGKVQQQHSSESYAAYAQNRTLYHLCLICIKQMSARQHHCHICKVCIPQYDHHCTWINNCVGKHNLLRFYAFLYLIFISLLWIGYLSIRVFEYTIDQSYKSQFFQVRTWFTEHGRPIIFGLCIFIFLVFFIFGLPLLFLILVQTKNLLLGKTTYERYSKAQQSLLSREGSLLNIGKSRPETTVLSLKNCLNMCYQYQSQNKEERQFSNSTSSSANRIGH